MSRVLRAPLVHFLAVGGLLVVARTWWVGAGSPAQPTILLSAADVGRLREAWTEEHGTPPTPAIEAGLLRDAVDDEVLYREALAAGIDRRDGAVHERLVRLGGFVGEEGERDRAGLEREARRLGLDRSDIVIRRHLVHMMRLAMEQPRPEDLPDEAAERAYLAAHAGEFAQPATVRLTHVFLSADRRGAAVASDADAVLAQLRRGGASPDAAAALGDPFLAGADIGPASASDLARIFGPALARAVAEAPLATWVGPLRSPFGFHLVWVHERRPAQVPPLETVRSRVRLRMLDERREQWAQERIERLRARYQVRIEAPATGADRY